MAINLDAIRAKLGDLQKNTGKSEKQENLWKPEGTQVIRIVPYQFNTENPFNELYFHYEFVIAPLFGSIIFISIIN
jgi:hypothetical protein